MPLIDVSEVLSDVFIAGEPFTVIRRQETVTSGGVVSIATTTLAAFGSIQPTGDNSLLREEAFQMQQQTIKVITNFLLRGASKDAANASFQPDLVLWKGNYFIVRSTDDYSQYGAGMIEAECVEIDYNDFAATPPT